MPPRARLFPHAVGCRLTPDVYEKLCALARVQHRTVSQLLRTWVEEKVLAESARRGDPVAERKDVGV